MGRNSIARSLTLIILFLMSNISYSLDKRLKLYEIEKTTTFEDLDKYILSFGLERDKNYYLNYKSTIDTLAYYSTGSNANWDNSVTIIFTPQSHIVSSYRYTWKFDIMLEDEYTPHDYEIESNNDKDYLKKCELYWMNIYKVLEGKYGKPNSVMINERPGYTTNYRYVTKKEQLDTINYPHLMGNISHFEVYWNNKSRNVALEFFCGGAKSAHFSYEYLNYDNERLISEETNTIIKKERLSKIIWWSIGLILASIAIYFLVKEYIKYANMEKEETLRKQKEAQQLLDLKKKEKEEEMKQRALQLEVIKTEHNKYVSKLNEKYGNCDKTIRLNTNNPYEIFEILVFSESKRVVIGKKDFSFQDIIDCQVNDNSKETETVQTFKGDSIARTNTNTGSMIGRSVAGGLLLGNVGAIIGGSTASKNTVIQHEPDTSIHNKRIDHDFTIAITVKDLENPVIYINVGSRTELKDEIYSLMKVIMTMK